jgi:protocatechuate 3,4-dioxygenase beta subunit
MSTTQSTSKLWLLSAFALGLAVLLWLGLRDRGESRESDSPANDLDSVADRAKKTQGSSAAPAITPTSAAGRVSASDGQPIADALVTLAPLDDGDRAPISVRSEAGGDWSIAAIEPGRYALSATAPGFLAGLRPSITLRSGSDNAGLDLQLEPGGNTLSGVVHDTTGGVIEGALIQVTPQAGLLRMRERDSYFVATDAEGRYAVQIPDGRHRVRASHLDYTSEQVVLELAGAAQQRDFSLVPTAVLEGVVRRESDGQPVPAAEVFWARERNTMLPGGERISTRERGGRVLADAQGRFRIRGLPPGMVELTARASMLASEAGTEIPVGIAERVEGVELWLVAAADVRGRVTAAADDAPIEGANVQLMSELGPNPGARSDGEGHFVIHGVLPGGYGVLASAEGFRTAKPERIEIGTGDARELDLTLERGATIRGRVEPAVLAEVAIELRPETMQIGSGRMMTLSSMGPATSDGSTGDFELGPVEPGRYTLDARAADGRGGTVEVEVGANGAEGVIIALEDRAVLAGTVQDWNGKAVGDVSVRARKQSPGHGSLSVVVNGRELTAASSPTSTDGRFEIAGLAAGTWVVEVVDAQGDLLGTGEQSLVVALEHGRREELAIRVEPRDGTITGTVRDAEGHAVADAWVSAAFMPAAAEPKPDEGPRMRAEMRMIVADGDGGTAPARPPVLTDAEGRFRFTGLRRGDYLLTAELDGGTSKATLERVQPDSDVVLELAPLGALRGTVLSNGEPAECVALIRGPSQRRVKVRDGSFEVERLEPGRYTVEASAGDGSASTTVTIEAGMTAEVDLAMERFSKITGKVLDNEGKPIAGAELLVGAGGGGRIQITREDSDPQYLTEADGSFEIHAAAGARVLIVQGPDSPMPLVIKPFVAESGQDLDLGELRQQEMEGMVMGAKEE